MGIRVSRGGDDVDRGDVALIADSQSWFHSQEVNVMIDNKASVPSA